MNWKILVPGLLLVVGLVALFASGFGRDPRALPTTLEGRPAPAFSLPTLEGERIALEDLRGHPVVVNFWATWCAPCIQDNQMLMQLARIYEPQGVVFLGVLYGDEPDRARRWVRRQESMYPTLVDEERRMIIDYAVGGVPETFVIDGQGRIAHKIVGVVRPAELRAVLEELL